MYRRVDPCWQQKKLLFLGLQPSHRRVLGHRGTAKVDCPLGVTGPDDLSQSACIGESGTPMPGAWQRMRNGLACVNGQRRFPQNGEFSTEETSNGMTF